MIVFFVEGDPVPKQSFRYSRHGGGYTAQSVKDWQERVAWTAKSRMIGKEMFLGPVSIRLIFYLKDRRRRDWDNLAKGVMDGLNKIVFRDDSQVEIAYVQKVYCIDFSGVHVEIKELEAAE